MRGAVVGLVLVVAVACSGDDVSVEADLPDLELREVTYHVRGSAPSVSITMSNASGNTEQASNRSVPLGTDEDPGGGLTIGRVPPGTFLYISAQNEGRFGTVQCRITVDGVEVARASSDGGHTIATCEANA